MSHANARLTPMGRLLIIQRIQGGMPQAHVAAQMSLSRATVAKWWKRWQADGEPGLVGPVVSAPSVASAHRGRR